MTPARTMPDAASWSRIGIAVAAAVAVILPVALFGPWLPLLDLVAFVGMDSAPPRLSYGPLHYTVFQFTYVGHYAIGRVLLSLGFSPSAQIAAFYLLQALVFTGIVWRLVTWLTPELWLSALLVALGLASFWDGLFLWGGPLPFSLAAAALGLATLQTVKETTAPAAANPLAVPLLALLSMVFHPFATPFALVLAAWRLLFVAERRRQTVGMFAAILAFAWVIKSESPETVGSAALWSLFRNPFGQLTARFASLFTADATSTRWLFGFTPSALETYFFIMGVIHFAGFATSPAVAFLSRDQPRLRLLAALSASVGLMYFCANRVETVIPQWPERILTLYSPFTFAAGVCCPVYLLRRWRPEIIGRCDRPGTLAWAVPLGVAAAVIIAQAPILRLGQNVAANLARAREDIVKSGIANCFVVTADIRKIAPFYLRCVPFLLVSDRALVDRNITLFTEWHAQPRHPTRLVESWFDLGRPAYEASFATDTSGVLSVGLKGVPRGQVPVPFGQARSQDSPHPPVALREFGLGNTLFDLGCRRDAVRHYEASVRSAPDFVDARNNLAVTYGNDGRIAEAIDEFARIVQIQPEHTEARCNLADLLVSRGREGEAREHYETILRSRPDFFRAQQGLQKLKRP